jgi:hypothetical protein
VDFGKSGYDLEFAMDTGFIDTCKFNMWLRIPTTPKARNTTDKRLGTEDGDDTSMDSESTTRYSKVDSPMMRLM